MAKYSIYSDRHYQTWPSWHLIYEWEDEISNLLRIPILQTPYLRNPIHKKTNKILQKLLHFDLTSIKNSANENDINIYFELAIKNFRNFSNQSKTIPIIIDFWGVKNAVSLNRYYRKCPYILVSSLEVLNFLYKSNCSLNLIHFPLSLPDKYRLEPNHTFEKKYDLVLVGRTNSVLWEYLKKYEIAHPELEYLYQEHKNGELYYRSNKIGIIGKFQSREEYINLIRNAKISLYATPGIDGGEKRTNGFNPVTPRFLELLSAGCHVIARYPQNEESEFYQLDTICPSVNNYEDFSKRMNYALNTHELPIKRNSEYLNKHYTSTRIDILRKILTN